MTKPHNPVELTGKKLAFFPSNSPGALGFHAKTRVERSQQRRFREMPEARVAYQKALSMSQQEPGKKILKKD